MTPWGNPRLIHPKDITILNSLLKRSITFLATGFGAGYAPFAPGTFGTLAGLPLWWLLQDLSIVIYLLVVILLFVAGIPVCGWMSRHLGVEDAPVIVWDEIVGLLVTLFLVPAGWPWVILGFLLFRVFDIIKPWPIGLIDSKIKGGLGIMLDDLVAALFALILLQLIYWQFGSSLF